MQMTLGSAPLPRISDESGISLVELLVAMVSALVVAAAIMGLLVVSQHQTAILRDVGQATQYGRTAMTRIVDELHSSCIAKEFAPVQKESTPSKLILQNAYSKEAEIKSGERTREDIITFNSASRTLTDETLPSTGGEYPAFTFGGTPSKEIIGSNISETKQGARSVPIFTYYEYKKAPEPDGSTEASTTLKEVTSVPAKGFSESEANAIAGVGISFTAAPASGLETVGRSVNLNTLVTLAFSAPNTEAEIKDGPCR
jgi:type II secretory pathway pseudopilin PulG